MKQMMFEFNPDVCISCGACAVACMDQNDTDPEVQLPFRHVQVIEKVKERETVFTNVSIACMHCSDAPCVQACPAGCLYKDEATGLTLYDNNKCIGCHSCVMACPFGAPVFTETGRMAKCDGCVVRLEHGMEPACVRVCLYDALKLVPVEAAEENRWDRVLKRLGAIVNNPK